MIEASKYLFHTFVITDLLKASKKKRRVLARHFLISYNTIET